MTKINYLLAAASHRAGKIDDYGNGVAGKDVLKLHLDQLLKTDTSALEQLTLIRATPLARNGEEVSKYYWDVQDRLDALQCPTVIVDVPDQWWSYSSWIRTAAMFRTAFDYYILIEDDYYPSRSDFAQCLVAEHKKKLPNGGYLNSFTTDHAAVSNGIVDAASFIAGIDQYENPCSALASGAQRNFGREYFKTMADYTDSYHGLFWGGRILSMQHEGLPPPTELIISPIQMVNGGKIEQIIHQPTSLGETHRRLATNIVERIDDTD